MGKNFGEKAKNRDFGGGQMDKICEERHKRVDERLDTQDRRLNNHGERIDALEQSRSRTDTRLENLCEKIESLVTTMRWFMGLAVGALISFFFYAIQQNIFK